MKKEDCIFCKIAGGEIPSNTIVARALKEVLHCDGLNVLQNNGLIAGQTVYHFHMHLIPRYEGDDVTIGWKEHSTEDIDMEQLRQDIKKAL